MKIVFKTKYGTFIQDEDSLNVAKKMNEVGGKFTAIVTDPPYGLKFMGKEWDKGVQGVAYWKEFLNVLKPGSFLLAFGGTRTYHRLACAIEDGGAISILFIDFYHGLIFIKSKTPATG